MAASTYNSAGIMGLLTDEQRAYYSDYDALDKAGLSLDIEHWAMYSSWLIAEAAFIIHGICPEKGYEYMRDIPPALLHKVRATLQVSERAALDGKISDRVDPLEYLKWARSVDILVASQLWKSVERLTVKRAEHQLEVEDRLIDLAALRKPIADEVEAKQLLKPKFWVKQLSSNYGYFPPLEDVLERLSKEGAEIPSAQTVYMHLKVQENQLTKLRFCEKNNTLSYQNIDNLWKEVSFKVIGQAIAARVLRAPPQTSKKKSN